MDKLEYLRFSCRSTFDIVLEGLKRFPATFGRWLVSWRLASIGRRSPGGPGLGRLRSQHEEWSEEFVRPISGIHPIALTLLGA